MKTLTLRKIGLLSYATLLAIIGATIGLIVGLFFALFAGLFAISDSKASSLAAGGFGIMAIIFLPVFYGAGAFIIGVIQAFILNLALKFTKGFKIMVDEK